MSMLPFLPPRLSLVALLLTGSAATVAPHDIHATHTRAVVENGSVLWKVRCFSDDLEKGLKAYAKRPGFTLKSDRSADSLFTAYFNDKVRVAADGRPLTAKLLQTGTDSDPVGGTVHWYLLQLDAPKAPQRLTVRNTLLAELFGNQANVVVIMAMPGEQRHSLYFGDGDMAAQTVDLTR
jgi:hypothetical protein